MKISIEQLKKIIKEETSSVLKEMVDTTQINFDNELKDDMEEWAEINKIVIEDIENHNTFILNRGAIVDREKLEEFLVKKGYIMDAWMIYLGMDGEKRPTVKISNNVYRNNTQRL